METEKELYAVVSVNELLSMIDIIKEKNDNEILNCSTIILKFNISETEENQLQFTSKISSEIWEMSKKLGINNSDKIKSLKLQCERIYGVDLNVR